VPGVHVDYIWEPDPIVFADAIFTVDAALQHREIPLAFAAGEVKADIRERFRTKTDPGGEPWEPWADSYAPRAEAYPNIDLLRRDDDLYQAATSDAAVVVSNDSVFYHAENIPEYGIWHQEGRPSRRTKGGSPNPLPQRQFLGLSDETISVIFVAFADWFDRAIDLFTTSRGRIGRRHAMREGTGQFIPRAAPMPSRVRG